MYGGDQGYGYGGAAEVSLAMVVCPLRAIYCREKSTSPFRRTKIAIVAGCDHIARLFMVAKRLFPSF